MDNKQKEQMKKGLVFGGLGLLFALSMWFIFAPSGKDKTAAEQGLNDSIPQATTEKLTENKRKADELGDKTHEEEQTRERWADYRTISHRTPLHQRRSVQKQPLLRQR